MEELWEASSGVRSEEADAELLILLRTSFFCTPRPNNTHTHQKAYRKVGVGGRGGGVFLTETVGIQESRHIKGACVSNSNCRHTRRHTKMEACLTEIMGIQESRQKRGHACLTETGDTRRHTEKGACMSNRDCRHTRRHTKMGHAWLTETVGIQGGIQKWGMHG